MKKGFMGLMAATMFLASASLRAEGTGTGFLAGQLRHARVQMALKNKGPALSAKLRQAGISPEALQIVLVAYKAEEVLEIYAKAKSAATYQKLVSYDICYASGRLGPKIKAGDRQVPEGFYFIDRFNPASSYHLSLGINYPNAADQRRNKAVNPGGDIFIHGSCVSIGCLAMRDDKIEEIYLYAAYAKNSGQTRIPVYIFPFRMNDANLRKYSNASVLPFWKNLRQGHDQFMQHKQALNFRIEPQGAYTFY
ncbi:MAG: L,D-transpeptidase family protein [Zoogloeaceae bacterium]|nr:L,D-transpeptidase family protein [Zoogloeaceae bacterium]